MSRAVRNRTSAASLALPPVAYKHVLASVGAVRRGGLHRFHHSALFSQAAYEVFPAASRKALVGAEGIQFLGAQIARLAVKQRQVLKLAQPGETDRALTWP